MILLDSKPTPAEFEDTDPCSSRREDNHPSTSYSSAPPPSYDDLYPAAPAAHPTFRRRTYSFLPPPTRDVYLRSSSNAALYPFAPSPQDMRFPHLPAESSKGFLGMKSGQSVSELLNPPPPSFRRVPPADTARTPFPIMVLVSEGSTIDKGFMYVAPDSTLSPHPFTTRDVNEHDWRQFLHDVRMAGTLSPMNVVVSAMVPLATGVGIIMRTCTSSRLSALLFVLNGLVSPGSHAHVLGHAETAAE